MARPNYSHSKRQRELVKKQKREEKLARNAAAVALTLGKGKVVLLGFRPQHRALTNATFPFLFNSLAWSVM